MSKPPLLSASLMVKKGDATVSSLARPTEESPVQQQRESLKFTNLVTVTVKLEREVYKALKHRAADTGMTNQQLISQAIVFFLKKEG